MPTTNSLLQMTFTDIQVIDKDTLVDVSNLKFDYTLSMQDRIRWVIQHTQNPFCFRYGDIGVKIEYTENGPPLSDLLLDFLTRKKSGLQ